jgi:hypothetical protein
MTKKSFNLRNVVAIAICLAGFLSANNVLAQHTEFEYTDASGVKAMYTTNHGVIIDCENCVTMKSIVSIPTDLTKWVLQDNVSNGANSYQLIKVNTNIFEENYFNVQIPSLTELVFPNTMIRIDLGWQNNFGNLRKVTFGKNVEFLGVFDDLPLDTIVFLGDKAFENFVEGDRLVGSFKGAPVACKVIVPCGTYAKFAASITANLNSYWGNIIVANLIESECLNTLTVLSSDVSLGNAISMSGCSVLTTTTPNNPTATFSGTATLYALAKAGKVFIGWADGNLDNPRTVLVSSDTTFTATFATCEETGIRSAQAAAPLKVYPNPALGTLYVELENYVTNGTLTLFDMSGKIVLSQPFSGNSAQINMSSLTAGNYILRLVENGAASAGVQVIKQ